MLLTIHYYVIFSVFGVALICFSIFINIHIYSQLFFNFLCQELEDPQLQYDYIIVGSGTAGSIVASSLSQEKKNNVLLLEAGPYSNFLLDIPAITPMLQKTQLDWQYETISQEFACRAMQNNKSFWPMGKIFGGTHRINNMIYIRGHEEDFKDWFKNKPDFNYEKDILHYFKKLENWADTENDKPIHLNSLEFISPLAEAILNASNYLGFPVKNINNYSRLGFMNPYVTTRKNKRWTTSHSLLNKNLKNLKIITNAMVDKVIFKNNYEASGVQFSFMGDKKIIRARKGIILSAGVIGSPKILLHSGIGPKKHLTNKKIGSKIDLPVGKNLMDHVTTGLDLIILNQTLPINIQSLSSPVSAYNYFFKGSGVWTTVGCEVIGFCHTNSSLLDVKPNLQFMILPVGISSDGGKHLKNVLGIEQKIWNSYFSNLVGKQVISILPIVLHPKSRGYVQLQNSNLDLPPIINPNYLSDQNDVEILIEGIEIIKKIIQTEPMQKLGAKLNSQKFPGCENLEFDTKEYWECYIRHLTLTSYHPGGTCKMGDSYDKKSVVDYHFKVIGTNKLFVADGSVMPTLPSGNPNAAIAMLAAMAADTVKYLQFLTEGNCKKIQIFTKENMCIDDKKIGK